MAAFKGFKDSGYNKIAKAMGYNGPMDRFKDFLASNPAMQKKMDDYTTKAMRMARGGVVKRYEAGGTVDNFNNQLKAKQDAYNNPDLYNDAALNKANEDIFNNSKKGSNYNGPANVTDPGDLPNYGIGDFDPQKTQQARLSAERDIQATDQYKQFKKLQQEFENREDVVAFKKKSEAFYANLDSQVQSGQLTQFQAQQKANQFNQENPQPQAPQALRDMAASVQTMQNKKAHEYYNSYGGTSSDIYAFNPNDKLGTMYFNQLPQFQLLDQQATNQNNQQSNQQSNQQNNQQNNQQSNQQSNQQNNQQNNQQSNQQSNQQNNQQNNQQGTTETGGDTGGEDAANPAMSAQTIGDVAADRMYEGAMPEGGVYRPVGTTITDEQDIEEGSGQLQGDIITRDKVTTVDAAEAANVERKESVGYDATTSYGAMEDLTDKTKAATGEVTKEVEAQTSDTSLVANLEAAQGQTLVAKNEITRKLLNDEKISPVANAQTAATFTEAIEAATATPSEKATISGQLTKLMEDFDANNPPPWAAASLRKAQSDLVKRGLGASSIAGQAIIQAALEAAAPIAQADARIQADFELQNLSNRQARAILSAEQRAKFMGIEFDQDFQARVKNAATISDIANQNFTADQQIQLENSRAANTMNMQNLSNEQALVIAEASALAGMDLSNLNNRQQTSVQNAKNFLDMDLSNLSNEQQTTMIALQQLSQSILNDQAAENAAANFNATSENQVNQFYDSMTATINQHNSNVNNAANQYNAGVENAALQFDANILNEREQWNAKNKLLVDQFAAQWRRDIATADTAAINEANKVNSQNVLGISNDSFNKIYNTYNDTLEWAWQSSENEAELANKVTVATIQANATMAAAKLGLDASESASWGETFIKIIDGKVGSTLIDKGWNALFGSGGLFT